MIFGIRCTLLTAMALAVATPVAAQNVNDDRNFAIGATVQLQGCVVAGERAGTFVFSRVTVWPVQSSPRGPYGPRHFWLENASPQLAEHLGQTVQVTGVIIGISESEIEREPGLSPVGDRVAIELPIGDIFTSPDLAGIPVSQIGSAVDMKIMLLKVRVESRLTVMKTCLPVVR